MKSCNGCEKRGKCKELCKDIKNILLKSKCYDSDYIRPRVLIDGRKVYREIPFTSLEVNGGQLFTDKN